MDILYTVIIIMEILTLKFGIIFGILQLTKFFTENRWILQLLHLLAILNMSIYIQDYTLSIN